MAKKLKFIADKYSGVEGAAFYLSMVLDIFHRHNKKSKFKIPFYSLTFDNNFLKVDEWVDEDQYTKLSESILEDAKKTGLKSYNTLAKEITKRADYIEKESPKILLKLEGFSDKQLLLAYKNYMDLYSSSYSLGVITFIYEQILSQQLFESVSNRYKNAGSIIHAAIRTKYKSFLIKSEESLFKIRSAKNKITKVKKAEEYLKNFYYIKTGYSTQETLTIKNILEMSRQIGVNRSKNIPSKTKANFLPKEKLIIELFKSTEIIRDQRKRINLIGTFTMHDFLSETVKRSGLNEKLAMRAFWFELKDILFNPDKIKSKLINRRFASGVIDNDNVYYLEYLALKSRNKNNKELVCKGVPASKGVVRGSVSIVYGPKDFSKFKKGQVLVTEMTRPDFVPLMKIASAIVTDEGGLTSHAAIVARELNIPCVIGTKIATQILKNGHMVVVDANKGIVRKI